MLLWPIATQDKNFNILGAPFCLVLDLVRYSLPSFDQACQQISYDAFMDKVSAECAELAEVTCGELVLESMMVDTIASDDSKASIKVIASLFASKLRKCIRAACGRDLIPTGHDSSMLRY